VHVALVNSPIPSGKQSSLLDVGNLIGHRNSPGTPGNLIAMQIIQRLYDQTMSLAAHRHARWWLAAVSFAESSFFPLPPDLMLIPMVLADRRSAWINAAICTLASVLGGIAGYLIGALLFEVIGQPLLALYHAEAAFQHFEALYKEYGALIVAAGGFTPVPYKVITIASGAVALNPLVFIVASAASRGARFFLVAGLLYWFGPPIRSFIERYLPWLTIAFFILLILGFVAVTSLM
jgi:membrane protein YqaA with SNARE-associated domain